MKKVFTLFSICLIALGAMATDPVVVECPDSLGTKENYSFESNGVSVSCTKGAMSGSYFSCHAGYSITFSASSAIKGVVINGYVKKGFVPTASNGTISYVDASSGNVTADPVVVIKDIDNKSVTISCNKQMRCYSLEVYFEANPTATIEGGGSQGGGDGDVVMKGFQYADVGYYTDNNQNYWAIDLYKDYDYDEGEYTYPDFYAIIEAKSSTKLNGTYSINNTYAGYWTSAKDSVEFTSGTLTIGATGEEDEDGYPTYRFSCSMKTSAGKTYTMNVVLGVYAMDYDNEYEEITLEDEAVVGLKEVKSQSNVKKVLRQGQLLLLKDGRYYNLNGQQVK